MNAAAARAVRTCISCPCLAVMLSGEKPLGKQEHSKLSPSAKGRGRAALCSRDVVLVELSVSAACAQLRQLTGLC